MIVTVSQKTTKEAENIPPIFYAVAPEGNVSLGMTLGEALVALLLHNKEQGSLDASAVSPPLLFILRNSQGDQFFSDAQNTRLQTLRSQRRSGLLSSADEGELDDLLQAEIRASGERAAFLAQQTASLI